MYTGSKFRNEKVLDQKPIQFRDPMNPSENVTSETPRISNSALPDSSSIYNLFGSMSRKILEENDVLRVLRSICEEGCRVLGADRAMVVQVTGSDGYINREILYAHNEPLELIESLEANHRPSFVSEVFVKGELEVIPDVLKDPRTADPEITRKIGYRTLCVIPLHVEGKSFAGLILHHESCCEYGENDYRLAKALGDLASLAIEKSKILRNVEQKAARLEIVEKIAKAVNSTLEPQDIFQTVVQEIRKAVHCERCVISTIELENNRYIYWHFESDIEIPSRNEIIGEDEWKGEGVYDKKRPLYISDLADEGLNGHRRLAEGGFRSCLLIPIVQNDRCIAHLHIASTRVDAFTIEDEELLISVADHLGSAIRNATLFGETEEKEKRLAKLVEVNQRLTRGLDLQSLLDSLVQAAVELLQGNHSRLFLFDEDKEALTLKAWYGEAPDFEQTGWTLKERATIIEEVFQTGKEIIVHDVPTSHKKRTLEWLKEREIYSLIAQPLFKGDKIIGVINCLSEKRGFFSRDDLELLGSFASQATIAIEENRLFNEARDHAARQEIIASIAKAIGSTMEPEALFKTIVSEIRKAVPCERCVIATLNWEASQYLNWYSDSDIPIESNKLALEKGDWWDQAVCENKVVIIDDFQEVSFPRGRELAKAGFRSAIRVPILRDGKYIAHLGLTSTRPKAFTASDKELLISIVGHLGPAIRNVKLYREVKERASRLSVLNEVNQKISANLSLDETLESIVRAVVKLLGSDHCRLFLVDPQSLSAHLQASFGCLSEIQSPHVPYQFGEGLVGWTVKKGIPANIPDVKKDDRWLQRGWANHSGVRSCVSYPLFVKNSVVGVINTLSRQVGFFNDEALELLDSIAYQAAVAINNASLYKVADKRASRLAMLNDLNQKIAENLDLAEILSNIEETTLDLTGADYVRIYLLDESSSKLVLRAGIGRVPGPVKDSKVAIMQGEGLAGAVFQDGIPINISDIQTDSSWMIHSGWVKEMDLHAYIGQPIRRGEKILGIVSCLSQKTGFFDDEDLQLLGTLASHSAIAIEKSRLFEETLKHAERQGITAKIAKAVGSTLEPDKLFKTIVQEIQKVVPCERCFISTLDQDLEYNWDSESDADIESYGQTDIEGVFYWAREVCEGKRLINVGNLRGSVLSRAQKLAEAGFQSALAVPILQGERGIAHLSLMSTKCGAFTTEHEMFLTSINDHLGSVIQNASLYNAAKKRAMRFAILNELNKKITENLDLQEVLSSFAMSTVRLVNAAHVQIFLFDEATSRLTLRVSSGGVHRPGNDESAPRSEEDMTGYVFEEGKPVISPNVLADLRFTNLKWLQERGFHAYIGQPIRRSGKTIGVISCLSQLEGFFNDEDLEFLGALASQAAIAIQNAGVHLKLKKSLEELRRSQEMIIRAEKLSSLGVLAAGAAHEILNPSSVIQIRAELIKNKAPRESKEKKNSEIILKNIERIRKICDNLRRFSREENARHRVFSLEYLIRETVEMFEHEFRPRNIEIEFDLDYNVSMIRGESHHIQQVLVILLTNSRDAMPDGGRITIKSNDITIDGKIWRKVSISDTGKGIPEPIKSKIFDPFFTTKSEDEGTGLGLSVLHGIMENHNGTVQVESVVGKGTTFVICLPTVEGYFHREAYSDDEFGHSSSGDFISQ